MAEARTHFDYLLNALELAGRSENPAAEGYADKRRALFAYVRDLESRASGAPFSRAAITRERDRFRRALVALADHPHGVRIPKRITDVIAAARDGEGRGDDAE